MAKKKINKPTRKKAITAKRVQATENDPIELPRVEHKPEVDDDEDCGDDGLTIRRRLFVQHITSTACGNATKAARLAGYASDNTESLKATAARLLSFVTVQKAIAREFARRGLDPDSLRLRASELSGATMANFLKVGPDGQPVMDWESASSAGAISQIKEYSEDGFQGSDGKPVIIKRKFKIFDPMRALELAAKMQGLLVEKPPEEAEPPLIRMRPINRMVASDETTGSN